MDSKLADAFRFHMRNECPAFYYTQGYKGKNSWAEKAYGVAAEALKRARQDVAAGKTRYPAPIRQRYPNSMADGLRLVGRVVADYGECNGLWDSRKSSGWYADPYQNDVCYGVVYQLPARNGHARYVAGYEFSHIDGGPTLELNRVFTSKSGNGGTWGSAQDDRAARDAAFYANSLAKSAAEEERDYQTAWAAGSRYADESAELMSTRAELRRILAERRALKGQTSYPALCGAITARVHDLLDRMSDNRKTMRDLAEGECTDLYFWNGDKTLQDAFCEGAGLQSFPV